MIYIAAQACHICCHFSNYVEFVSCSWSKTILECQKTIIKTLFDLHQLGLPVLGILWRKMIESL